MRKGNDRVSTATLLVVALTVSMSHAQDAKAVLTAAQNAMGSTLLGNMQFTATGSMHSAGPSDLPDAPSPAFKVTRYRLDIDYMVPAMRMDVERINPDRGGRPPAAPQRHIETVRTTLSWNMTDLNGSDAVVAPVGERLLRIWTSPHGVVKAAQKAGADLKVAVEKGANGRTVTVLTFPAAGTIIKATLNADNLVERVEARASDAAGGDVITEIVYSGYKDAKQISATPVHPEDLTGVLFPTRIVSKRSGRPMLDLTVTSARPNAYMVFPIPDNIKKSAQGTPPAARGR